MVKSNIKGKKKKSLVKNIEKNKIDMVAMKKQCKLITLIILILIIIGSVFTTWYVVDQKFNNIDPESGLDYDNFDENNVLNEEGLIGNAKVMINITK